MKKKIILCISIVFCTFIQMWGQTPNDSVASAFRQGNAELLAHHLAASVELTLGDSTRTVQRSTVTARLRDFLLVNKVKKFTVNHEAERESSSLIVMTLTSAKGMFRINCFLCREKGRFLIKQLRIEEVHE